MNPPGPKTSRSRFSRARPGLPLLLSIAVHAVIVAAAGLYVVNKAVREKKAGFEAGPVPATPPSQREVEHRVQIARRAGSAAPAVPVSMQRILSSAPGALALPDLPDLPVSDTSLFGGSFGGAGTGVGLGSATGLASGLGNVGSGGRGFVSLTFLGLANQRVRKVAFVVDVSRDLMDIRKGGFEAFGVIRDEIMKLVSQLPPGGEFGVVLFGASASDLTLFSEALVPATLAQKEAFFAWMKPVNADPGKLGTRSAGAHRAWKGRSQPVPGLDERLLPPPWLRGLEAALGMRPETVYLITGGASTALRRRSSERMEILQRRNEQARERLRRSGVDPDGVAPARAAALARARQQLHEVNETLKAQGKRPLIVSDTRRIFLPDFQAELKRLGFSIELDATGWTDAQGRPIWEMGVSEHERVEFGEVLTHVARLQSALLREKAVIQPFLFVGPEEKPREPLENLTALARRNGGRCEVLTARRLEELNRR